MLEHPAGFRQMTGVRIVAPELRETSVTSDMAGQKVIDLKAGPEHSLELEFDGCRDGHAFDFHPELPLVFRW